MATLVGICRDEESLFGERQLPLEIDETLTMVVQFPNSCLACEQQQLKLKEIEQFAAKYRMLSKEEITHAFTVSGKQLFSALSQTIPCVGCRRSVERLFYQLTNSGHPALHPLVVTEDAFLTLNDVSTINPKELCELFCSHGARLNSIIDAIPKNKKNRRCLLHSLESQRSKPVGSWLEVWDLMSKECREEVVLVESDILLETLESYLRKHRFCTECKSKVMRAYNILIGRIDASKEKGYVPHLYKGIRCCPPERHVHVHGETDFISCLITRAEPEFRGNNRERHAKTVENAQEEVLICLGICLFERLHRIWQRMHEEEQTWQILFYLGISELRKKFELAVEKKQGFSQLERVCEELTREEQAKLQRMEHKRLKRKKKKSKLIVLENGDETKENEGSCKCDGDHRMPDVHTESWKNEQSLSLCNCDMLAQESCSSPCPYDQPLSCSCCKLCSCQQRKNSLTTDKNGSSYSDSGYCSAHSNESSCSSSCDNSEVACSDGFCNHENTLARSCGLDSPTKSSKNDCTAGNKKHTTKRTCNGGVSRCCMFDSSCGMSLQDMLEESCASDDDDDEKIPPEEVLELKANFCQIDKQRQELRYVLRQRFAKLRQGVRFQPLATVVVRNSQQ